MRPRLFRRRRRVTFTIEHDTYTILSRLIAERGGRMSDLLRKMIDHTIAREQRKKLRAAERAQRSVA
jgi:hypothetical protein